MSFCCNSIKPQRQPQIATINKSRRPLWRFTAAVGAYSGEGVAFWQFVDLGWGLILGGLSRGGGNLRIYGISAIEWIETARKKIFRENEKPRIGIGFESIVKKAKKSDYIKYPVVQRKKEELDETANEHLVIDRDSSHTT